MKKTLYRLLCAVLTFSVLLTMLALPAFAEGELLGRVRIHLLGDSTVASYSQSMNSQTDITGWGQALEAVMNDSVTVFNHARSGATTKMFLEGTAAYYGALWHTVLKDVKSGDYVLIQFGHNDSNTRKYNAVPDGENANNYYGIPQGEYQENLTKMVRDIKNAGAIPVLVTAPERKTHAQYSSQNYADTFNGFMTSVHTVSQNENVPLIDLNAWSKNKYSTICGENFRTDKTAIGEIPALDAFFANGGADITHFSSVGALAIADFIADELADTDENLVLFKRSTAPVKNDIEYTTVYAYEDFEKATNEENSIPKLATQDHWGNRNTLATFGKDNGKRELVTENGDTFLRYSESTGENQLNFTLSNPVSDSCSVFDFRFRLSNSAQTNQMYVRMYSASGEMNRFYCTDTASSKTLNMNINSVTANKFTEGNFKSGQWNDVRIITDNLNGKYHLFLNGKPLYFDGVNQYGGGLKYFYFGITVKETTSVDFDDIRVFGISEKKAAKMMLQSAEDYLAEKSFVLSEERKDGRITDKSLGLGSVYYIPASVTSGGASFTLGNAVLGTAGKFTVSSENAGTTEPYYEVTQITAPYGYADGGETEAYIPFTVAVGAVSLTKNVRINLKRRLLNGSDETLEIGVPKIGGAEYTNPRGDDISLQTFKNTAERIYSQTRIKNTGSLARNLIAALVFFDLDGKMLSISSTDNNNGISVIELEPNQTAQFSHNIIKENMDNVSYAKFLIMDADNLKPVIKPIKIQ